jgi:hypothetical protein
MFWSCGSIMKSTAADGELDRRDRAARAMLSSLSPVELGTRAWLIPRKSSLLIHPPRSIDRSHLPAAQYAS